MECFCLPFSGIVKGLICERRWGGWRVAGPFLILKMNGQKETEGKSSQEQVTLMTAVRRGDSGDRGASGCDASRGA